MPIKLVMLPPHTPTTREWVKRLVALPEISLVVAENADQATKEIVDADAAYGTLTPELLQSARRLRWLQSPQIAPPAGYYFPELVTHPVTVTNFRGIFNDRIGVHIMAFVLAFARGLHRYYPQQLRREWRQATPRNAGVVHLPDATAVIVGVGEIGAETARLAATFGMHVIGVDARRKDKPTGVAELHSPSMLDDILPRGDFVILTVPLTPDTAGYMNRKRFQKMKPSAFFINIGRGKTTRLDDLVAALEAGELAGAGLDVFEQEPLPADHPLWTMPGVLITPHTAGYGPGLDERRYEIISDNYRRLLAGETMRNVVDKANWF